MEPLLINRRTKEGGFAIIDLMKNGVDYIGVAVGAMIFNDQGKVLLAKRSHTVKNERGHWENPGGSVEFGETQEEAVRREMREELGIEVDMLKVFSAADHLVPKEKQHWVATTFLARIRPGEEPRIMEPDKCDEIGWFGLDKLPQPLSIITEIDLERYHNQVPESFGVSQKAVIGDGSGKCLVLLRGKTAPSNPSKWDLPGGDLDYGEDAVKSMLREIDEETGISVGHLEPLDVEAHINSQGTHWTTIGWSALALGSDVRISWEHDEHKWVTLDEFRKLRSIPKVARFVEKYFSSFEPK